MITPLDKSIVCPTLIGRATLLDALNYLVMRAVTGQGQVALIAGEAGMGKSRLVAEVTAHAQRQGFVVLQGRCFEPDRVLPYAPLLDLLRVDLAGREPDAIAPALGPMAPQLAGLLPEYRSLLADLAPLPARSRAGAPPDRPGVRAILLSSRDCSATAYHRRRPALE
jgi:hypothetical protein